MNNFSQVHELLQHNQQLHARTANFYSALSNEAKCERVKMLLNTLVKHESDLSSSLQAYIKKAPDKILNTYFQFDHEHSVEELFVTQFDAAQISSDNVEIMATAFDDYFCHLYSEMQEAVDCEMVQDLFENLHDHMLEEKKRLSIDIYSMMDM
jgi:signal transduction protein with GAF and PtsI domain